MSFRHRFSREMGRVGIQTNQRKREKQELGFALCPQKRSKSRPGTTTNKVSQQKYRVVLCYILFSVRKNRLPDCFPG